MKFSKQMVPFKSFLDRFNKSLGPKRQELIAQKDNNIEELQKSIQEDEQIADYETEDQTIRERERERITEKRQQIDALENEREKNLKKALHQERMRNTFKKYGFTVTAWQLEVIVSLLIRGLRSVVKAVEDYFKTIGSKIAGILPGLMGSMVGFVFRALASMISSSVKMHGF